MEPSNHHHSEPHRARKPWLLPPHIGWPLFVIAILMMSVGAATITVIAARSDGGAQVVSDYQAVGVNWNERAAVQAASDNLGWTAEVQVADETLENGLRPVMLTVRDRDGQPITDLQGTVRLERPQLAQAVTQLPVQPLPDALGPYVFNAPITATGLWDFVIDVTHGDARFVTTVRTEVLR